MKKALVFLGFFINIVAFSQIDTVDNGSYAGAGDGEVLYTAFQKVNQAIKAVNTGSVTGNFVDLNDVPGSYTGFGEYLVRVATAENGLEFIEPYTYLNGLTLTGSNVEIGGSLYKSTEIDIGGNIFSIDGVAGALYLGHTSGLNILRQRANTFEIEAEVTLDIGLFTSSGTGGSFQFDATDNIFEDYKSSGSQTGLKYDDDYQDLEDLSLVHKKYVDDAIATGGGDTINILDIVFPTLSASFMRETEAISNPDSGEFALITNGTNDLYTISDYEDFTADGDTAICGFSGHYEISASFSFYCSTATAQTWSLGMFVNGIKSLEQQTGTANSTLPINISINAGIALSIDDSVSFRIANETSGANDATMVSGSYIIQFVHE